tara:strand:- start:30561 stop:30728 length:168 start_codon:yes stop_codon:yes gene_type:complete
MVNIHVEPMEFCLMNMEAYIYQEKGVRVKIKPPVTPKEVELFEKMYTYLSNKFGI